MPSPEDNRQLVVTGLGVVSAIGQGRADFLEGLLAGRHAFGVMQRPGRQLPAGNASDAASAFIGAEIADLALPAQLTVASPRTVSWTGRAVLACVAEAWEEAALYGVDPTRIGLVIGGSNVQQREQVTTHDRYRGREDFVRPTYAITFMDSDLCGLCTEVFGIRGMAYTVGGASASGQVAVIEALEAVMAGRVDVCVAVGALMDLSYWECQGLRSLGAMGSDRYGAEPALACRPFDRDTDGFIFGEACAAVVVERADLAHRRQVSPYGCLAGWSMRMDANRQPNPSGAGETAVILAAMARAGMAASDIDYVNPHGTGSRLGDETELASLRACGLEHAYINTTKSLIGHGLTAAGTVELAAVLLQMRAARLHPVRNLDDPLDPALRWTGPHAVEHRIDGALNLSMGFGGMNTAVCVRRCG